MIKLSRLAALAAPVLFATAAFAEDPKLPAQGDTFTAFGHSGDWYVFTDVSRGSCLVEKTDASGNVVQIGLTEDNKHAYIAVYALIPEDLRGKREKLTVEVAGQTHTGRLWPWQRHKSDAYSGGYLLADSFDLFAQSEEVTEIIAFPKEEIEVTISLDGSAEAIEMAKECIAAQSS
ncbi:hypothetical protein [Marinibacterium profundimaris]|uniref:hypothetical protein n=1 Tax=Marinibacterium profundimaris TaxID=1679460 RepID=UPI000B51F7A0|nr:hypothetical protein [Marinibacterium profundimaris]